MGQVDIQGRIYINSHEIKNGLVLHSFLMENKSIFNFATVKMKFCSSKNESLKIMIFHFVDKCDLCDIPSNLKTSGHFSKMVKIEKNFRF